MKILDVKGDLLDFPHCNVICHCANTLGVMGAGIALQIKKRYPEVAKVDTKGFLRGWNNLGSTSCCEISKNKFVVNCYAQETIGSKDRDVNYEAVARCMQEIRGNTQFQNLTLGFPVNFGSCLAGGNWRIIRTIIEETFKWSHDIVFVEYKK